MIRIMANSSNNNGQTPGIDPALISAQRLQPYVARCKGDVTVALDLYLRDRSLSSSLFSRSSNHRGRSSKLDRQSSSLEVRPRLAQAIRKHLRPAHI